jgi:hypothetical protein
MWFCVLELQQQQIQQQPLIWEQDMDVTVAAVVAAVLSAGGSSRRRSRGQLLHLWC